MTILRWCPTNLDLIVAGAEWSKAVAKEAVSAFALFKLQTSLKGPILPRSILLSLIKYLVSQKNSGEHSEDKCLSAIQIVVERVRTKDALLLIQDCIKYCGIESSSSKSLWAFTFKLLAKRVSPEDAIVIVREFAKHMSESGWDLRSYFHDAISNAVQHVREAEAIKIVRMFIQGYGSIDYKVDSLWIAEVGSRICRDEAEDVVMKLIELALSNRAHEPVMNVFVKVVSRLDDTKRYEIVIKLIQLCDGAERSLKISLIEAIGSIARQLSESDSEKVVPKLIDHATADNDLEFCWIRAVETAVGRLGPDNAAGIARALIHRYNPKAYWSSSWIDAITNAVERLNELDAAEIIRDLVPLFLKAEDNDYWSFLETIRGCAYRLNAIDAANLLRKFSHEYGSAEDAVKERYKTVVYGIARRVNEKDAAMFINDLIRQCHTIHTSETAGHWALIRLISSRLSAMDALAILDVLLTLSYSSESACRDDIFRAIDSVACEIDEFEAENVILKVLQLYRSERGVARLVYCNVIRILSRRVNVRDVHSAFSYIIAIYDTADEDMRKIWCEIMINLARPTNGTALVYLCNQLIFRGIIAPVVSLVSNAMDVAIISRSAKDVSRKPLVVLRAVLRQSKNTGDEELILRAVDGIAPDEIIEALQAFPKSEGFSPSEQFSLLLTTMVPYSEFAPRFAYSLKKGNASNFRNTCLVNVRRCGVKHGLIIESRDIRRIAKNKEAKNKQIWVRKESFGKLLASPALLDEFAQSVRAPKQKKSKNS